MNEEGRIHKFEVVHGGVLARPSVDNLVRLKGFEPLTFRYALLDKLFLNGSDFEGSTYTKN